MIVMEEPDRKQIFNEKSKHVKEDEEGSHDALQNNHGQLVDNIMSSC